MLTGYPYVLSYYDGMVLTFIVVALVGFGIGVLSGLLGVGGGVIMVPMLRLAFGMNPVASTATSLFTIIPTSASGAVTHIRNKTCVPKLGLALGAAGACTSPLGVWLANVSPGWMVMLAVAVVVGYSAYTMLRKALKAPKPGEPGAEAIPAIPVLSGGDFAKAAAIGAAAGMASGYVGLGGGFLMIPLMMAWLGIPMRLASGTSLIAVMMLALPATIAQCAYGNVDFLMGIAMACGSIPGAFFGARLVSRVPERALRFAFAAFLGIAAVLLVAKEL